MRDAAKDWANANILGYYKNLRSGLNLEVRHSGVKQAVQHGGGPDKLLAFVAIPEVLRDGVVVFDGVNPKNNKGRLVVVSGKVVIRGDGYYVTAGFREDSNGRLLYDHELNGSGKSR